MRLIPTLAFLAAFCANSAQATVRYVNAAATGANNGTSWANAFTTLQAGIGAATSGDTIWVANGIYKPTTTASRTISFVLPNGVALFGGFTGTETAVSQRAYSTWQTVLSGDIGQPGVHADNSYHVVTASGIGATRLDGFKIMHGRSDNGVVAHGGGLDIGGCTIINCFITQNYAYTSGGGIRCGGGTQLLNCIITNNTAGALGGGISSSGLTIKDCDISGNHSMSVGGGCYFAYGGFHSLDRCTITGNTAVNEGGAFCATNPFVRVSNSLIAGNTGSDMAVFQADNTGMDPVSFINCTIVHNRNTNPVGDFLFKLRAFDALRNCIVWGNASGSLSNSYPAITNSVLQSAYSTAGNDTLDPQFVTPASAAQAPFLVTGYDYHLKATSHAIDTGNSTYLHFLSTLDLDSNARIQNGRLDLGAYESNYCNATLALGPGSTLLCPGSSAVLSVNGGTAWLWSNGAATSAITVTSPGTYNVAVTDAAGCRAYLRRTLNPTTTMLSINGSAELCPGDTVQLTTGGNVLSWLWNTGATTGGISVTTPGRYTVTGTGADGCTVSDSIDITDATPQPVITISGGLLQAGTFATYQWRLNGIDIPGATGPSHIPVANGSYTVRVTNAGGCTGTSAPVNVTNAGLAEAAAGQGFRIFPNPARREISVVLQTGAARVQLVLHNALGQAVQRWEPGRVPAGKAVTLQLQAHPAGMYYLRLSTGGDSSVQPVQVASE